MLNDTLGWVCGLRGTLLKTTDAGVNWQSVDIGYPNISYWAIDFLDEKLGVITLGNGSILKTTDGGENWTTIQTGTTNALYCLDIIDSLHIVAAGAWYQVAYTSDGGTTWILNNELPFDANAIQFTDTSTGYAVGGESTQISKTTNNGANWFGIDGGGEWGIQLLQDGTGYTVGQNVKIYKRTNGLENWKKLILNEDWSDVFFINENKGFIISGNLGSGLYKTEDGGISYEKVDGAPIGHDLLFLDSLTGFIGGNKIYKTTNGGITWYTTTGSAGAVKIFFVNKTLGWAVGGGNIYKTTDGGENWFTQIQATDGFTSIFFVDSLNGWATSRYIWQTTNGGGNWIQRADVQLYFSRDIYFTSIDTGFVTVDLGGHDLYKTTNGGVSWQRETRIETAYSIHTFPNKYHWISNGWSTGQVWETINNGINWTEISGNLPAIFGQFHAPIEYIGFAVSGYGLVLRYEDTSYVPVELISFKGKIENEKITLSWQTASELNNRGFQIEKSFDKENWFSIGFIEGKGTSTKINNYSFTDNNIITGAQYYRLRQVDHNEQHKFSDILEVIGNSMVTFQLYPSYPNPFNSSTVILYQVPHTSFINISLYNITGEKIIEIVNEEKSQGLHKELFQSSLLPSGIYFVRMTTNSGFYSVNKITLIK
ncbi:MAG: T9SS type A sorting domain-containing protein, partial [Ignavibacteriaceae bacterium]|nr:T9SS type A sorting domain-containing protein [Ignavibacteriaceae bacterium]